MSKTKETRYEKLRRERRYILASVDLDIVGRMFLNSDMEYSFEGIPRDALFVSADRDVMHQSFSFLYLHESFQQVPEGDLPAPRYLTVHTKPKSTKQSNKHEVEG